MNLASEQMFLYFFHMFLGPRIIKTLENYTFNPSQKRIAQNLDEPRAFGVTIIRSNLEGLCEFPDLNLQEMQ